MSTDRNRSIAQRLEEAAELLESQGANPFRINASRRAAATIGGLGRDLADLVAEGGPRALEELPTIGSGIAASIREMLTTGRWSQLERLRGTADAASLFTTVPGIGPELAGRIHDTLDIDTLEALESAAYDGRLESVQGSGLAACGPSARDWRWRWVAPARSIRRRSAPSRPSTCRSRSTSPTAPRPPPESCAGLHPGGSTRQARRGCRSCT